MKPTGQEWRIWKKREFRRLAREGKAIPADWAAHWDARQGLEIHFPPSPHLTAEELIDLRSAAFERKKAYEEGRTLIRVDVKDPGPIAILHLGDPHVDDDGCDWPTLRAHVELVKRTPGMFVANVGDTRNNWVGRLGRLYGNQSTSAKEATILAEWLIRTLEGRWLYLIGGNHDCWSGEDDPLAWMAWQINALYEPSEARLGLNFPSGRQVIVNARHDFSGSSQWNPAHGPMKAAQLGLRDDILICGHLHKSGYSPLKDPDTGRICHCLQVSTYKRFDHYAREKGFRDQTISPCVVTVIDPGAEHPANLIQVFWDPFEAAEYLAHKRRRSA